jgi:hypothetical protein
MEAMVSHNLVVWNNLSFWIDILYCDFFNFSSSTNGNGKLGLISSFSTFMLILGSPAYMQFCPGLGQYFRSQLVEIWLLIENMGNAGISLRILFLLEFS